MNMTKKLPLFFSVFVACAPTSMTWAQQAARPALPPQTPPAIQQDMEVIQRYRDEVERRTHNQTSGQAASRTPATSVAPVAVAVERDPFEVSPQLRESNRRNRNGGIGGTQEGVVLSRALHLKAIARGPSGGVARIQSGRDVLTVRDGDELDVDGMRYTVHVEQDGLVLRGAGAPQFKLLVR